MSAIQGARTEEYFLNTNAYFKAITSFDCNISAIAAKVTIIAFPIILLVTLILDFFRFGQETPGNLPPQNEEDPTHESPTVIEAPEFAALPPREKAGALAQQLKQALDQESVRSGYYRNSGPSMQNMVTALSTYARTGELDRVIQVQQAHGQGSSIQPNTVRTTFQAALINVHGGVRETLNAIKTDLANEPTTPYKTACLNVATTAERIVGFIRSLNIPA